MVTLPQPKLTKDSAREPWLCRRNHPHGHSRLLEGVKVTGITAGTQPQWLPQMSDLGNLLRISVSNFRIGRGKEENEISFQLQLLETFRDECSQIAIPL